MALCDQGYLCEVCGLEVEDLIDSDLYLRFVLGEIAPEELHQVRERHIRCNPVLAQFIVHNDFPAVECQGAFAKSLLDPGFAASEERRVTRGWLRLREIVELGLTRIVDYPLPEVLAAWQAAACHDPIESSSE